MVDFVVFVCVCEGRGLIVLDYIVKVVMLKINLIFILSVYYVVFFCFLIIDIWNFFWGKSIFFLL